MNHFKIRLQGKIVLTSKVNMLQLSGKKRNNSFLPQFVKNILLMNITCACAKIVLVALMCITKTMPKPN
jgi:hypothetical protein